MLIRPLDLRGLSRPFPYTHAIDSSYGENDGFILTRSILVLLLFLIQLSHQHIFLHVPKFLFSVMSVSTALTGQLVFNIVYTKRESISPLVFSTYQLMSHWKHCQHYQI